MPTSFYYGNSNNALPELGNESFDYFNFFDKLSMCGAIFKDENITIRFFEKNCLVQGDAVHDFMTIVGLDIDVSKATKSNSSNGFIKTKVEHIINRYRLRPYLEREVRSSLSNSGESLPSRDEAIKGYMIYKIDSIHGKLLMKLRRIFNINIYIIHKLRFSK